MSPVGLEAGAQHSLSPVKAESRAVMTKLAPSRCTTLLNIAHPPKRTCPAGRDRRGREVSLAMHKNAAATAIGKVHARDR
jgi:hypothetical protein